VSHDVRRGAGLRAGHAGFQAGIRQALSSRSCTLSGRVKVAKRRVPQCGIFLLVDSAPEITVLQLPKFKVEATELIGGDGIDAVAVYLIDHPDAGDVIPGAGGVRKLRWAAKGKGKRGGARIIYVYVVIAGRIYLLRCYAKSVKTDLTADEKQQLRQIVAHLKGVQ
jgi:hypothetical protein